MPYSEKRKRFYPTLRDEPGKFWAKVQSGAPDACWPWMGALSTQGYGRAGKRGYAHRLAYELAVGAIPAGLHIIHSCDNRVCCNPSHLSPGTQSENMRGAAERGRIRGGGPRRFDRAEARALLEQGLSLREVGRRLGVTHGSLAKALRRP